MKIKVSPTVEPKVVKTIESVLSKYNKKLRIKKADLYFQSKETEVMLSLEIDPIKGYHRSYNLYPYGELIEKLESSLNSSLRKHKGDVVSVSAGTWDIDIELSFCGKD
jgi:hypothetical protein